MNTVLITGGAGFIGSHLANHLLDHGYRVRVLDNLCPRQHGDAGAGGKRPPALSRDIELQVGDIRDPSAVERALDRVDATFHFAGLVGASQSMYEAVDYSSVNNVGTSVLLEAIARRPIKRLVVGSSMSVYGEGSYRDATGTEHHAVVRPFAQLRRGDWEVRNAGGGVLEPMATSERTQVSLQSVYAISKYDQERMSLVMGRAFGVPTTALRFFSVYGPGQALPSQYAGVLSNFAARLLTGTAPQLFEDGRQTRDFINVRDVVRACRLVLESNGYVDGRVINIASGQPREISSVALEMATALGCPNLLPEVTGTHRFGDVRHCFADIEAARRLLSFRADVPFRKGLVELAEWLTGDLTRDRIVRAQRPSERSGAIPGA